LVSYFLCGQPQMTNPGISRDNRISDEGLNRLRRQLQSDVRISRPVLDQWVQRYGEKAIKLLKEFGISY